MNSKVNEINNYKLPLLHISSNHQEILKSIAVILMVLDHYAKIYLDLPNILEILGRVVFPIFCYILVYNYLFRTTNKHKYLSKLFIFSLISQPIFTYAFSTPKSFLNILFTLFIGLLFIFAFEKIKLYVEKANENSKLLIIGLGIIIGGVAFVILGKYVSYYWFGLILIFGFYYYLNAPSHLKLFILISCVFFANSMSFSVYQMIAGVSFFYVVYLVSMIKIQIKRFPGMAFYFFYPTHLICLKLLY